ncbi:fimbria/pilus outer membrane usher protein [Paeniroseomonas aquatica]|uniref:fimbria/pilus outer membrane usher protein n=1 Tax=Paeniroseomonas aquatica TaxID=373043 RepID=UPI0036213F67
MTRRRPGPALLRCLTAVVLLAGGGPARGTERALLLDVFINAHPSGIVAEFHERAGQLFARRDELQTLGLQPGPGGAADEVPLGGWAGLSWRLDERAQRLHVTVPPHLLRPSRLGPAGALEAGRPALESAWGAVLNYDLIGTGLLGSGLGRPGAGSQGGPGHGLADRVLAQALLDGRMFSPFGVAATSYLGRADAGAAAFTRLESSWVFSEPDSMLRARAGDLVSSGLSWSRPVRLGGVQFSTDFAIRPDLVTFPTPTITGTVAVPSTVDVLVNGVRLLGQEVQPGPFEIRQLPVVTGAGEVSVVTRDASGQDVRRSLPIYASAAMLAPGLSSFSAEAGLVRLNYGLAGGDYRAPTGAVTYRRGLADWLTVEGHAETSLGHGAPGGGGVLAPWRWPVAGWPPPCRGWGPVPRRGGQHRRRAHRRPRLGRGREDRSGAQRRGRGAGLDAGVPRHRRQLRRPVSTASAARQPGLDPRPLRHIRTGLYRPAARSGLDRRAAVPWGAQQLRPALARAGDAGLAALRQPLPPPLRQPCLCLGEWLPGLRGQRGARRGHQRRTRTAQHGGRKPRHGARAKLRRPPGQPCGGRQRRLRGPAPAAARRSRTRAGDG